MITSLASYFEQQKSMLDFFEDVVLNKRITFSIPDPSLDTVRIDFDRRGPFSDILCELTSRGTAAAIDMFLSAQIATNGPKVYRPDAQTCFALEAVRPQVPYEDYEQPFETFCVELAEEYARARQVGMARPLAVFLHRMPAILLTAVLWTDANSTTNSFKPQNAAETIEQMLARGHGRIWEDSDPVTSEETTFTEGCIRLGVNACMVLTHYGCRDLGPVNPSQANRLRRHAQAAKRQGRDPRSAERELRALPQLFGFAQQVTLYERETRSPTERNGGGEARTLRPHWRSGYWRRQWYGVGKADHRKVFIKATFVNEHLLLGKTSATSVTYVASPRTSGGL